MTTVQKKDYQTLFWVPMLFQTASQSESLIEEMLEMISAFNETDQSHNARNSELNNNENQKRRQQILGETMNAEVTATKVQVIPKSENTRYILLTVLKVHSITATVIKVINVLYYIRNISCLVNCMTMS